MPVRTIRSAPVAESRGGCALHLKQGVAGEVRQPTGRVMLSRLGLTSPAAPIP